MVAMETVKIASTHRLGLEKSYQLTLDSGSGHAETLRFSYSPRQGQYEGSIDLLSSPVQSCPLPLTQPHSQSLLTFLPQPPYLQTAAQIVIIR